MSQTGEDDSSPSPRPSLDQVLAELDGGSPLLERLARVQAALARERAEASGLCEELLALPCDAQEEAVRRDARFRSWGICEGLLCRSADPRTAPPESGRLASLALMVAACLDGALHTTAVVRDLEARAWACVGQARLRTGDQDGAERALTEAACHLAYGTGDLLVEARLLELEAEVRRRQGRTRESAALLRQAEARYREVGESELAAQARSTREGLPATGATNR